jgi:hypothetical protein
MGHQEEINFLTVCSTAQATSKIDVSSAVSNSQNQRTRRLRNVIPKKKLILHVGGDSKTNNKVVTVTFDDSEIN